MVVAQKAVGGIRLATFNIKHGAPAVGELGDPEKVAEACAELGADILALQEVDLGIRRSEYADLAKLAAEASGMKQVFAKTMRLQGGRFGNALLVRGDIVDVQMLTLKGALRYRSLGNQRFRVGRKPPRGAIVAKARLPQGDISVAATHLSIEHRASRDQLSLVMAALACREGPHVLVGDLNLSRASVLKDPSLATMELADGPPTFPAQGPARHIDHIAVRGLAIQSVEAVEFPISDHRALVAEAAFINPL